MREFLASLMPKRKPIGFAVRAIAFLLCAVFAGGLLLTAVYSLPTDRMYTHAKEGRKHLDQTYPQVTKFAMSTLDYWTDAIMLNTAITDTGKPAYTQAMENRRVINQYESPTDALNAFFDTCETNKDKLFTSAPTCEYSRYWHGYLVLLKPALIFFSYGQLRTLNLIVQTLINLIICILLWKKELRGAILPYILMIGLLMPVATAYSMQYATMFYIFAVTSIILLIWYERLDSGDGLLFLFLAAGIATAYFDFLTYPLISLGVPLALLVYIRHSTSVSRGLGEVVQKSLIWGIGYIGMWVGKWALGSSVLGRSVFTNAASAFENRSFLNRDSLEALSGMYYENLRGLAYTPVMAIALIFTGICIYRFFKARKMGGNMPFKTAFGLAAPFLLICLMPFAWYFVTVNHSLVHFFFTYKTLAVTAFSGMCIFPYLYAGGRENR